MSKPFGQPKQKLRKFLIALQFYEGDRDAAEDLASLIADLERTRNHDADFMLMRRADCRELSATVKAKLDAKFDKVHLFTCRRVDAKNYPHGSNQMFYDLVSLMGSYSPFKDEYFAFINLETDGTPTRPGWISELIAEWKKANTEGKAAIGHIEDNPHHHLNGLAVYAQDMVYRVGPGRLLGGSPQVTFDIRHSPVILPLAKDTPLIYFEYRRPTITPEELFAPRKGGIVPALWHGVKNGTARAAVRARHVSFTDAAPVAYPDGDLVADANYHAVQAANTGLKVENAKMKEEMVKIVTNDVREQLGQQIKDEAEKTLTAYSTYLRGARDEPTPTKRPNVYTYHQPATKANVDEQQAIQSLWRTAWTSRGFNPVVLTLRDAARNPRFDDFQLHIERFPFLGGKKESMNRFNRWLALEMAGSGLMVDVDVLPGEFTPKDIIRPDVGLVLSPKESGVISAAFFDAPNLVKFIHEMELYDPRPEDKVDGRLCVTDLTVWLAHYPDAVESTVVENTAGTAGAKLVKFAGKGIGRTSDAMRMFLSSYETVVA